MYWIWRGVWLITENTLRGGLLGFPGNFRFDQMDELLWNALSLILLAEVLRALSESDFRISVLKVFRSNSDLMRTPCNIFLLKLHIEILTVETEIYSLNYVKCVNTAYVKCNLITRIKWKIWFLSHNLKFLRIHIEI